MNYEELVHEFLDGALESGKEEQLFLSLSASDDLRTELKQQLAIRNAVRSDIKALTPRAESTLRIFSELGFTMPVPAPTPAPVPSPVGFWTKFTGFMGKNTSNLITGIASSVATAIFMIMLLKSGIINFGNETDNLKNISKSIPVIDSRETPITSDLNNSLKENKKTYDTDKIANEPKIVYKYIYVKDNIQKADVPETKPDGKDNTSNNEQLISTLSDFVPSHPNSINTIDRNRRGFIESNLDSRILPELITIYDISNPEKITHFVIEANGSTYFYDIQERITQSNQQDLSNTSLSLRYKFNEEIQVGFEYRRESFYQKFEGFETENLYAYEQNPNLESISLNFRYAPEFLNFSYAKPFVQTSLGGTKVGPIGRLMVGTKINFYDNYSLLLSSDYSVLGFSHNKNWFLASKWGMHFGFGIDF
jgi:hypothetical protein